MSADTASGDLTAGRPAPEAAGKRGPLGLIAGSGDLPAVLAEEATRHGRPVFVVSIDGETDCDLSAYPGTRLPIGAAGRLKSALKAAGCEDVLMTGNFRRPRFSDIEWTMGTVKALSSIMRLKIGGDDRVVNGVVQIFEAEGFRIVGPREVAPGLVAPAGPVGRKTPSRAARADIDFGRGAIATMGPLDIGQAVVVLNERVVAVEAAEGTNAMIKRCEDLRGNGRIAEASPSGVLVKAAKPGQEMRLDMPVIGTQTIAAAADAGLSGVAVEAGNVLIPDLDAVRRAADAADLFLIGFDAADPASATDR